MMSPAFKYRAVLFFALSLLPTASFAQEPPAAMPSPFFRFNSAEGLRLPSLDPPSSLHSEMPTMSSDLALQNYEKRLQDSSALQSYTDETLILAELPESSQRGAFELQRAYVAPHTLTYKPIRFTGDNFVKSNVITRVLQSEVDYVSKGIRSQEELSSLNYKFSYKGVQDLNGHTVHVYQVKPRKKHAGLFKGRVYLDAHTGALVRSEGSIPKSPSFFVRKLEFVQDYIDFGRYTVPSHLHTTAQARIVGKTVVDIYHRAYQLQVDGSTSGSTSFAGQ